MIRITPRKLCLGLTFLVLFGVSFVLYEMFRLHNTTKSILEKAESNLSRHEKVLKYALTNSERLPTGNLVKLFSNSHENKSAENETEKLAKMWFMNGGNLRPEYVKTKIPLELWPEQSTHDRIVDQLMYLPENYSSELNPSSALDSQTFRENLKNIFLVGDFEDMSYVLGRSLFWQDKCPVNTCNLTDSIDEAGSAAAVIVRGNYMTALHTLIPRTPAQIWILYLLESPMNTEKMGSLHNVFNWTASYRHDSDIVTPYAKFLSYYVANLYVPTKVELIEHRNFAANKTKKVAWFVSNCDAQNDRHLYAENLSHFIEIDIYGSCGTKSCPRDKNDECLAMLDRDYKFYLAFENSNCDDYITEKFFENGLRRDLVPIVMGPRREDYERVAPFHSFIHVNDFASPKKLAEYLLVLDANDTLYNEYFTWKYTGEFINTYFWCRLCALLHAPHEPKTYDDMQKWWARPGICQG